MTAINRGLLALALGLSLTHGTAVVAQTAGADATAIRYVQALTYPEGSTIAVDFDGTSRLPDAGAEAKVERKPGVTEIEIELDEMKPATAFGGDFNTYVFWIVSPEGHVDNVGEFILEGNRSKLNVSTPLETFGMLVTAEPHFLVSRPSRFVVLENTETIGAGDAQLVGSRLEYPGAGETYRFDVETLARAEETSGETRTHLQAARTAVALAERAGAETHAAAELDQARASLRNAEAAAAVNDSPQKELAAAHEVIRLAVKAQQMAEEQAFAAALNRERERHADEVARLAQAIASARTDAERARAQADQQAFEAQLEASARQAAQERAAVATERATEAERAALAESHRAARAEVEAEREGQRAAKAEREGREARGRLREALARIADVEDSARGLIISIPNVLFDLDKATLRPEGRETLAKLSGVLQVARDYQLQIEGYTDNLGTQEYNKQLGHDRATAVRDYLISQHIDFGQVSVKSFGEAKPIASNETPEGRQTNRRVEIVVVEGPAFAMPSSPE
jgi:outer membrane protein OmpA-like peptidoglycan-associated protein